MKPLLRVSGLSKRFVLHNQGGIELPVLEGVALEAFRGECIALDGPSGAGKSTLLKLIYANYRASTGSIHVQHDDGVQGGAEVDMTQASAQTLLAVRRSTIGYVSQFLRTVPRVGSLDVVAEPLLAGTGADSDALRDAHRQAQDLLLRLRIPQRLWHVAPAAFSGGEQQRINLARSFVRDWPVLLLDEPTASLDAGNSATVVALINEVRKRGTTVIGIFHDARIREQVATRVLDMGCFQPGPGSR
ncbi:MAG: phosphonate C-P lyase system protein PhnL [Proteobacteria bacterium]|nr:phosphonate C-P lyase system protein PhnL [Pseudomonadota bacterium]